MKTALVNVQELSKLSCNGLNASDLRVMYSLIARLDDRNLVRTTQVEIAQHLERHPITVKRSIKRLIECGFIIECWRTGRSHTYKLNPNYCWRGSDDDHIRALMEHRRWCVIEGGKQD